MGVVVSGATIARAIGHGLSYPKIFSTACPIETLERVERVDPNALVGSVDT